MSAPPPRPFFLAALGLVLLFAALGPAIGGAIFIPLAVLVEAPTGSGAVLHIGAIAALIGHAIALIPAYVLGILPAAATGFGYALYDAWASPRASRALGAAAIGGALAYGIYLWLAALGAMLEASLGASAKGWLDELFSGEFDPSLQEALVASGAVAGLVCAMAAGLIGLTTRARVGRPA